MNVEIGTAVTQFPFWKYFFLQFSVQYLCSADLAHQAVYTDSDPDPCTFFVKNKKQRGNNFSIDVLHFKSLQDPGKAPQRKPS